MATKRYLSPTEHNNILRTSPHRYKGWLIEAVTLEVELNDGSRHQLIGYHSINEENVQALSGGVLAEFNREGFLAPMFMALASMANIQHLVALKNESLAMEAGQ